MTVLSLALLALPALCAPLPPGAPLEEAEAAIELGLRELSGLARDFEAGATVYAHATDLAAAAEARALESQRASVRVMEVHESIRNYRSELFRRFTQGVAGAFMKRGADEASKKTFDNYFDRSNRFERSFKAVFKERKRSVEVDAAALKAEKEKREALKRLRRRTACAWGAVAAAAAGLFALLLRRRKPPPVPVPVKPSGLRRPPGPGRLE